LGLALRFNFLFVLLIGIARLHRFNWSAAMACPTNRAITA
jgi:hypothetical protein